MSERESFLHAIATNPDDRLIRLVFADWLDEHGEHEEAERQRKLPDAIEWLQSICRTANAARHPGGNFTIDRLLDFGRSVSATTNTNIEVSNDIPDGGVVDVIRDRIPEFWEAWSIVTGLPLSPDIAQKCYYSSGYCCPNEIYPDAHVAGPKSAEFLHAEGMVRYQEQEQRRLDEEAARDHRLGEYDAIQDELERDRS